MGYVLILGGNSDIAKALAEKYASNEYNIYLAVKNPEELEETKHYINKIYGSDVQLFKFDVLEFYTHRNFYNKLDTKPDGVICAEGYIGDQKRAQKDFLEAKKIVDTNYTGIISILNTIANDFEARKEGFIIGIGSLAGENIDKTLYTYYSAKEGFDTYLSGLKDRLSQSNVDVLNFKPGFVQCEMTKNIEMENNSLLFPTDLAEMIFEAQQKGMEAVYAKGSNSLINFLSKLIHRNK